MTDKAMLINPKSSLGLTKRPNVWLNIHTRTEHKMLHKKKISRIRRRREKQRHEIKINIYLMFLLFLLLCFSSLSVPFQNQFFCNSLFPQCLFPTPTSHSSIPKKKNPLPFKMKTPLPAFTCSLFISSCKSSPVPAISQSPSSTTTMARWWYLWPHVPACSAPPETSPHSSKIAASSPEIVAPGKKKLHGRKALNGGLH